MLCLETAAEQANLHSHKMHNPENLKSTLSESEMQLLRV